MTGQQLLQQILQHPEIAPRLIGKQDAKGDEIAWCIFHEDGKGKPPHEPNLRIGPKGYYCTACKVSGGLRKLARHLGIGLSKEAKRLVKTWKYYSPDGSQILFYKDRFRLPDGGKDYGLRRAAPADWRECIHRAECQKGRFDCSGGSIWTLKEKPCSPACSPVLYNEPMLTVTPGELAHLPEGEQCCDVLSELGFTALCNPYGAGEWRVEYSEALRGWRVVIWTDADEPGRNHGLLVARSLWGKAASIRVVDLYPDRNDGSDIADWIAERRTRGMDDDAIRAELDALIEQAAEWQLPPDDSAAGLPILAPSETNRDTAIFLTPADLASSGGADEVDWLWQGFVALGHITLLAGKPRASGKLTLTFAMVAALLLGEPFLGFATRRVNGVVVLSEETFITLLDKTTLFGLAQCEQLLIAPRHTVARLSWEEAIEAAVAAAEGIGGELLVVNSFPHFAKLPPDGAKDASLITEVFRPLQAAAAKGLAVLPIHHERKGGGEAGEGVRDSGAIVASSDIILELGRVSADHPTARKVQVLSRFRSTPSDFVFDFDKDTGSYSFLGTLDEFQDAGKEVERDAASRKLIAHLTADQGLTQKEVAEKAKLGKSQVGELLSRAVAMGLASRSGRGAKNDPYQVPTGRTTPVLREVRRVVQMFPPTPSPIGTGGNKRRMGRLWTARILPTPSPPSSS